MPFNQFLNTIEGFIGNGLAAIGAAAGSISQASQDNTKLFLGTQRVKPVLGIGFKGVTYNAKASLQYEYDFATDGGAVGTITLNRGASGPIPANFVITHVNYFVNTAITSGGAATVSIGTASGTPANILAATAIGTMGTAGQKAAIPILTTPATAINVTTASYPVIVVATAALTAGNFTIQIDGFFTGADTQA